MTYSPRRTCRICRSPTQMIADLGAPALTCVFPKLGERVPRIPLTVRRCPECGLVQLGEETAPTLMYRDGYGYKSGVNETMRRHLAGIVKYASQFVKVGDWVLDIGYNDGTLLKAWGFHPVQRYGVDPLGLIVDDAEVIEAKFFAYDSDRPKFKVITSIAMFYDLADPVGFAEDVRKSLTDDGVWILEVQYAGAIQHGLWDGICHEHLTYYGLRQLGEIARRAGLRIFDYSFNEANGGSVRVTLKPADGLSCILPYEKWDWSDLQSMIELSAKNVRKTVDGWRTYVLGASTKGNTLLHMAWLDRDSIECAVERNPEKIGRLTPGSKIPIVGEEILRERPPQLLLVLPYHFKESILDRYSYLKGSGTRFLFPLPDVEVI